MHPDVDRLSIEGLESLAFPPTRRVLWDRTPNGPARRLSADAWRLAVSVSPGAVQELARNLAAGHGAGKCFLSARCSAHDQGRLEFLVDRFLHEATSLQESERIDCLIRCFSRLACDSRPLDESDALPTAAEIRTAVEARDAAVQSSVPLLPWNLFAWIAIIAVDGKHRQAHLRLHATPPTLAFSVVLLATPLRTLQTPLLSRLLMTRRDRSMGCGFLTLDRSRRVVCLLESDELVRKVPVVGMWVDLIGGVSPDKVSSASWWDAVEIIDNPSIWAAGARFVHARALKERVWVDDKTFLIMVAHHTATGGGPSGTMAGTCLSFFEATYDSVAPESMLVAPSDGAQVFPFGRPAR